MTGKMCLRLALVASLVLITAGGSAYAGTIGPICGSCFGGIYTLDVAQIAESSTTIDTWEITYKLDLTGSTLVGGWVTSLAAKVAEAYIDFRNVSYPSAGNWSGPIPGGLNSGGCNGTGAGFLCISEAPGAPNMTVGSVYEWKYQVDIAQGASLSAIGDIKANFNTPTQTSGLLLSEKISAAEAPAAAELSMLMFALGVFAVALRRS